MIPHCQIALLLDRDPSFSFQKLHCEDTYVDFFVPSFPLLCPNVLFFLTITRLHSCLNLYTTCICIRRDILSISCEQHLGPHKVRGMLK